MPRRNPNNAPDAPKTIDDLRRITGLGKDLIKQGIREGTLPGVIVGTRVVIPAAWFDAFLRNEWEPRKAITAPTETPTFIRSRKAS